MASRNQVTYSATGSTKREQWSNGTQAGDPTAGYAQLDPTTGAVIAGTSRALTAQESADLAAADLAVNQATLQVKLQQALATNTMYIGLASPTAAQTTAETKALAKQVNALIRLLLNQLDDTSGT